MKIEQVKPADLKRIVAIEKKRAFRPRKPVVKPRFNSELGNWPRRF